MYMDQEQVEYNDYGDLQAFVKFKEWTLVRHGEQILWGRGCVFIDIINAEDQGYEFYVGENVPWDDCFDDEEAGVFTLVAGSTIERDGSYDIDPATGYLGVALGEVYRKVIPAATSEATAIRSMPSEDLESAVIEA